MTLGVHFGDELAMLLRLTAFSTGDRAFHESSHELDQPRQLQSSDELARIPRRASSHVLCHVGLSRAWRPHASATRLSWTSRSDGFLLTLTL